MRSSSSTGRTASSRSALILSKPWVRAPILLLACLALGDGTLHFRRARAEAPSFVQRDPHLANATLQPKTLAWFEPASERGIGPLDAKTSDGTALLIGLVWRRGQRIDGLHVTAWNASTLAPRWVSDAIPAPWVSADSDSRFRLAVDAQTVTLADATGHSYALDVDTGKITAHDVPPTPVHYHQARVENAVSCPGANQMCMAGLTGMTVDVRGRNWATTIPAARSARLRFITSNDALVFVLVDDVLHVFDAQTGKHRGILEAP